MVSVIILDILMIILQQTEDRTPSRNNKTDISGTVTSEEI